MDSLTARTRAYQRWAFEADRSKATEPARRALDARFVALIDPDGVMPKRERDKRVAALRHAHFLDMARRSAEARRAKKKAQS